MSLGNNNTFYAGSGATPGNNADSDYGGTAGVGGPGATAGASNGVDGAPGRLVIIW
jgi:hypothetical protein